MRNIDDYECNYRASDIEKMQVKFRKRKVIELIERYPHGRILEIGCGDSPLFIDFDDFEEMTIIEPGKSFVDNAMDKTVGYLDKNIEIIRDYIENTIPELVGKEFDYIVCSSLLQEVEEPELILKAIKSLSRKKTIIHINVPNANSIHRLIAKDMGLLEDVHSVSDLGHQLQQNSVFDMTKMIEMVSNMGFEVIESGTYMPKFVTYSQIEKMLRHSIINEDYFEGLYSIGRYMPEIGSELYVQLKISE